MKQDDLPHATMMEVLQSGRCLRTGALVEVAGVLHECVEVLESENPHDDQLASELKMTLVVHARPNLTQAEAILSGKRTRSDWEIAPGVVRERLEVLDSEKSEVEVVPDRPNPLQPYGHQVVRVPNNRHRASAVYRNLALRVSGGEPLGIYAAARAEVESARENEDALANSGDAIDEVGRVLAELYQPGRTGGLYSGARLWELPPTGLVDNFPAPWLGPSTDGLDSISAWATRTEPAADEGVDVLWMTERAARWLEARGKPWDVAAKSLRSVERQRRADWKSRWGSDAAAPELGIPIGGTPPDGLLLAGWCPEPRESGRFPTVARMLARVAWRLIVRKHIQERYKRDRTQHPAMSATDAEQLAMWQRSRNRLVVRENGRAEVLSSEASDDSEPLGTFYVPNLRPEAAVAVLGTLHSVPAHRLVRWLAERIHERWERREDPREIVFAGGWNELAGELAGSSKRASGPAARKVRDAAIALAGVRLRWGVNETPVVSVSELGKSRNRRLVFKPHEPLLPGEVWMTEREQLTQSQKRARRRLVPIPAEPALVGRTQEHAAQLAMQVLFLAHLRNHTDRPDGSAEVKPETWKHLAEQASLPDSVCARVRAAWLEGTDAHPPFIEQVEPDRYRVAENDLHGPAARFMAEGADRTVQGRRKAVAANRKRAAARKR